MSAEDKKHRPRLLLRQQSERTGALAVVPLVFHVPKAYVKRPLVCFRYSGIAEKLDLEFLGFFSEPQANLTKTCPGGSLFLQPQENVCSPPEAVYKHA